MENVYRGVSCAIVLLLCPATCTDLYFVDRICCVFDRITM
jgi:hypothetical protein